MRYKYIFTIVLSLLLASSVFGRRNKCGDEVNRIVKQYASGTTQFLNDFPFGQSIKRNITAFKKVKGSYQVRKDIPGTDLKKGDIFYLDRAEKDHLEVFNKRGRAKMVLDLDGKLHVTKTKAAIAGKRTIDAK